MKKKDIEKICFYCGEKLPASHNGQLTADKHIISYKNCTSCNSQYIAEYYSDKKPGFYIYKISNKEFIK